MRVMSFDADLKGDGKGDAVGLRLNYGLGREAVMTCDGGTGIKFAITGSGRSPCWSAEPAAAPEQFPRNSIADAKTGGPSRSRLRYWPLDRKKPARANLTNFKWGLIAQGRE